VAPEDVIDHGWSPAVVRRAHHAWSGSWFARHRRLPKGALAVVVVATVVAVAAVSHQREPGPPLSAAITGLSIQVAPQTTRDADSPEVAQIVATYRVRRPASGGRLEVQGVSGPLVRASSASRGPTSAGGTTVVTVTARPDCSSPDSLEVTTGSYVLQVTRAGGADSGSASAIQVTGSPLDWSGAVRQDCWQDFAAQSLRVSGVRADVRPDSPQIDLQVSLHSTLPQDVRVQVVDIADVTTLVAPDAGTVRQGGVRVFRVRLPVPDCASGALPMSTVPSAASGGGPEPVLEWSLGPVEGEPIALLRTVLSSADRSAVRAAVRRVCARPGTTSG
jgi:hypothetical protein